MTVSVTNEEIVFYIEKGQGREKVGSKLLPENFKNDHICPYVALFTENDKIQIPGLIGSKQ